MTLTAVSGYTVTIGAVECLALQVAHGDSTGNYNGYPVINSTNAQIIVTIGGSEISTTIVSYTVAQPGLGYTYTRNTNIVLVNPSTTDFNASISGASFAYQSGYSYVLTFNTARGNSFSIQITR